MGGLHNAELCLTELEQDTHHNHTSDLNLALGLLDGLVDHYFWLEERDRSTLFQILIRRLVVHETGEIVDDELNSPFVYLRRIANNELADQWNNGSGRFSEGALSIAAEKPPLFDSGEWPRDEARVVLIWPFAISRPAAVITNRSLKKMNEPKRHTA